MIYHKKYFIYNILYIIYYRPASRPASRPTGRPAGGARTRYLQRPRPVGRSDVWLVGNILYIIYYKLNIFYDIPYNRLNDISYNISM